MQPAHTELPWRRNLIAVTGACFIGFAGFTLAMPFLPLYIRELGVTDVGTIAVWTGAALGITPALAALMSPFWGRMADRFGRKLMFARALVSCAVVMLAMAFVTRAWHVVALRAGLGLFTGYGGLALTMAAESAPRERTASAIGFVQTAQRLGPALGPAVGGLLAAMVGLRLSFVVAACFYVAALVLVMRLYSEHAPASPPAQGEDAQTMGYRGVLGIPHIPLFMAIVFAMTFVDKSVGPVLALYLEQLGVQTERVAVVAGWLFSLTAVSGAIGHHICSHLLQRVSAGSVIVGGGVTAGVGALAYAIGIGPWPLAVAATAVGLGTGLATTAAYACAGLEIPHSARGAGFGMLTGSALVGLAASPFVAGLLGGTTFRGLFVVDLLIVAAMVYWVRQKMIVNAAMRTETT